MDFTKYDAILGRGFISTFQKSNQEQDKYSAANNIYDWIAVPVASFFIKIHIDVYSFILRPGYGRHKYHVTFGKFEFKNTSAWKS